MKIPELLAPAGNIERLRFAYAYGADAVYVGGRNFSLRAKASNFSLDDIEAAAKYAHSINKRIYVTANIFARDSDFSALPEYILHLSDIAVDAVIVADPGVVRTIRKIAPDLRIHISTQANITNTESANFWFEQGASRVVLARELTASEVKHISENSMIETEMFIHGAMCISYSGRCLMSKFLAGRDGNRGDCAHSCRWRYHLQEEMRPGEYFPVEQDDSGTYFFNSKDLALINHIPELMNCGLSSLKIEGRMKSTHYVAAITKIYRQAIDRYVADPKSFQVDSEWLDEMQKVSHRLYSTGFFAGDRGEEIIDYARYEKTHDFVGLVEGYDQKNHMILVGVRNKLERTKPLEILSPEGLIQDFMIPEMIRLDDGSWSVINVAHADYKIGIPSDKAWSEFSILRRAVDMQK